MDNQTTNTPGELKDGIEKNEQDTIFSAGEFSLEGYDKSIKRARNVLFLVAGIQVIFGIFIGSMLSGDQAMYSIIITSVIGIVFFCLGLWTKQKPYTAIVVALILFVSLHLLDAFADPSAIFKGLLMKVLVILYLVRSLRDAREAQEMKKNFDAA